MSGILEWIGAAGSVIAAGLIASDLGRRWTGWAFVLFVAMSIAWIAAGLAKGNLPIAAQNALMLVVNGWGVWQYLLNPRKKREIELAENCTVRAQRQVEAEEATGASPA